MRQYEVSNLANGAAVSFAVQLQCKDNRDGGGLMALPCPIITINSPIIVVAIRPQVAID